MASSLLLLFTITSFVLKAAASNQGIQSVCIRDLAWVPGYRKKVIVNLLNDINYPSWTSKTRKHLTLPRGSPYAFACGACYTNWKIPSLSLRTTGTEALFSRVRSCSNKLEHRVNDRTNCLVSYGLTIPLESGGILECELNRDGKLTTERVTYSTTVVETESVAVGKIYANYEGFVKVSCPEVPLTDLKNLVYVWHFPNGQNGIVTKSLRKEVVLEGHENPYEVECSTYDTYYPTKVWKTSYIIYGHTENREDSVNTSNQSRATGPSKISLADVTMIVGALVVLLLLGSVLFAVCRETRLSNRRRANMRATKQLTEMDS